jgi:hypothetical protein
MPIKKIAHRTKMVKKRSKKMALNWVPSSFDEPDLKAKKEGFLLAAAPIIFPGEERVPKPPKGYLVMFLAFLLRGLSLCAHEFLHGLLFVYSVQLHQLTPNWILHNACFITLCESFRLCPSVSLDKNPELGGAVVSEGFRNIENKKFPTKMNKNNQDLIYEM